MQVSSALHLAEQRRRVLQAQLEASRETRPQLDANSTASASSPRSENTLPDKPEPPQGMTWAMANAIHLVEQMRASAGVQVACAAAPAPSPYLFECQSIEDSPGEPGNNLVDTVIARPPAPEMAQDVPAPAAAPRTPAHVKTFVELNLAALQAKKDGLLRLHYVLKAHDASGQGWVSEETARDATAFMYAWAGARYWLRKGDGTWWKWDKPAGKIGV